jgi:hypothetical protein
MMLDGDPSSPLWLRWVRELTVLAVDYSLEPRTLELLGLLGRGAATKTKAAIVRR